jgi:hypothetical protein
MDENQNLLIEDKAKMNTQIQTELAEIKHITIPKLDIYKCKMCR